MPQCRVRQNAGSGPACNDCESSFRNYDRAAGEVLAMTKKSVVQSELPWQVAGNLISGINFAMSHAAIPPDEQSPGMQILFVSDPPKQYT
jgi:hypothetical protein